MKRARNIAAVVLLLALAGCATKNVTSGGEPVTDLAVITAANKIDQADEGARIAGTVLLASRGLFSDAQWDTVADTSEAVQNALFLARDALQAFETGRGQAEATALDKSLAVLTFISGQLAAYKVQAEGVTP